MGLLVLLLCKAASFRSLHAQAAEVAATMQQSPHEIGSVARAAAKARINLRSTGTFLRDLINKTKNVG